MRIIVSICKEFRNVERVFSFYDKCEIHEIRQTYAECSKRSGTNLYRVNKVKWIQKVATNSTTIYLTVASEQKLLSIVQTVAINIRNFFPLQRCRLPFVPLFQIFPFLYFLLLNPLCAHFQKLVRRFYRIFINQLLRANPSKQRSAEVRSDDPEGQLIAR